MYRMYDVIREKEKKVKEYENGSHVKKTSQKPLKGRCGCPFVKNRDRIDTPRTKQKNDSRVSQRFYSSTPSSR